MNHRGPIVGSCGTVIGLGTAGSAIVALLMLVRFPASMVWLEWRAEA